MEKARLQMVFKNEEDKRVNFSVNEPREDLTAEEVRDSMDTLITANIFSSPGGDIITPVAAKVITTTVEELNI